MKKTEVADYIYIGVDVSKEKLDAYRPNTKKNETFLNQEADIETFCKSLKKFKTPVMVVVEGTGGYEGLLVRMLIKHKVDVAIVNARQVRDFANGIGMDAKTDPIDAYVIHRFAEVVKPSPKAMASEQEQKHSALVTRRAQVINLITQESNRLKQCWDKRSKESIGKMLEFLRKEAKTLDKELDAMLSLDEANQLSVSA